MSATLQTYPFHSTIESSSTDAEFLCRLGGVAVCPRQRAAQESPFRVSERGGFFATEDIRSRAAAPETRVGQFEPMPCSEGRADDQIVPINGQQGCIAAWQIGIDDPVRGEMRAKDAALDPASGILHDLLNEHSHRGAVVVAAVRDIQGADKLAGRSRTGASMQLMPVFRLAKCSSRWIVTGRPSIRQVPIPFVPSRLSLHTPPGVKPIRSKSSRSPARLRASRTTPSLSDSITAQPVAETIWNSWSSKGRATSSINSQRCRR